MSRRRLQTASTLPGELAHFLSTRNQFMPLEAADDYCCQSVIPIGRPSVQPWASWSMNANTTSPSYTEAQHYCVHRHPPEPSQCAVTHGKRSGAAKVSVMVVARCLSPGYGSTANFIKTRLQQDYDHAGCPVTGGRSP
jgi:hypothetical protein